VQVTTLATPFIVQDPIESNSESERRFRKAVDQWERYRGA